MSAYPLSDEGLTIFLFHGVVHSLGYSVRNYNRKHIEADYFAGLLKEWKRTGVPLSMDEVVEYHQSKRPYPRRSFAVTFDDGFENNFSVAAPVLDAMGVPAIFYCTTSFIENNGMSWIDRIELAFESCRQHEIRLPWSADLFAIDSVQGKIRTLDAIRSRVKGDSRLDSSEVVSAVYRELGETEVFSSNDPIDLKMNWNQVRELNDHKLFKVAGHSHTHAVLSFLGSEDLEREISTSIRLLDERAGIRSIHYAYPEGLTHCYSEAVIAELKKYGIRCAPSAIPGVNLLDTGLFDLRRVMVT